MSLTWKDVAGAIGAAAPMLGTLALGPAGGAIGAIVASALGVGNSPDEVAVALKDPASVAKLREIEANRQIELQKLITQAEQNRLQAEAQEIASVNATMQAEAQADHWPTYTWRPFIGFCVGFNTAAASVIVLGVYIPVMFGVATAAAALSTLPTVLGALAAINGTVLPILGIASWFRGKAQADPAIPTDNRG